MVSEKLTPRQQAFVSEYLLDLNATQAAIRAAYSERTVQVQSSRLLSNVMVQAAIQERQAVLAEKVQVTQERLVEEYAKAALADSDAPPTWADKKGAPDSLVRILGFQCMGLLR